MLVRSSHVCERICDCTYDVSAADTLRWTRATESKKVPFMLVTFLDADSRDTLCACPRGTLQRVVEQIQAHGYQPFAGAEVGLSSRPTLPPC